jgi:hypothetical protein
MCASIVVIIHRGRIANLSQAISLLIKHGVLTEDGVCCVRIHEVLADGSIGRDVIERYYQSVFTGIEVGLPAQGSDY